MAGAELRARMSFPYPIDGDHPLVPALHATFDAARDFGLNDDDLWLIVRRALSGADGDPELSGWVDRLNGALARAILSKPRSSVAGLVEEAWLQRRLAR